METTPPWRLAALGLATQLSGCLIAAPRPAGREHTPYDSLPALDVRTVDAASIAEKYGPPDLKCGDGRYWIDGWTVGHGALAAGSRRSADT